MSLPYRNIVVLTGAGISAESGIATFRSSDGLWENHKVEDVATPEGYEKNPVLVQNFYNARRRQLQSPEIAPNAAHLALAEFEAKFDGKFTLVTQNIDNLHERAGSQNVLHMHGELLNARCACSEQTQPWHGDLTVRDFCHCCQFPQPLRPDVVWFGEMPLHMNAIYDALQEADLFVAIGTSGVVYPAAGFVHTAHIEGAHTVELNLCPSEVESEFDEKIYGLASDVVVEYFHSLLRE